MQWTISQPKTHTRKHGAGFSLHFATPAPNASPRLCLLPPAPHASTLSLKQYVLGCSLHRVFRAMHAPPARLPNPNPEGRTSSTLHPNPEASPSSTPQPNPGPGLSSSSSLNPEAAAGCLNPHPKGALSEVAARHITASLIDILDHLHSLGIIYAVRSRLRMRIRAYVEIVTHSIPDKTAITLSKWLNAGP